MKLINLRELRQQTGRAEIGETNRRPIAMSFTEETLSLVASVVPIGKGKYGSAFFELAARLLVMLLRNGEDITYENCRNMLEAINSPYFVRNLQIMHDVMDELEG